jgi:hypothetical protein
VEVVAAFDKAPLERLEQSYDALLAYLEDPQNTPERAVADRKGSTAGGVKTERDKLNEKPLTRAEVQRLLREKLTPDQRVALRLALEDQRNEAVRPFLNEEAANLLALAALADEGSGKLGDIQRSRDSWLQTILFIIGIISLYQGAKGRIGLMGERWGARRQNKRVLTAYEAKRIVSGTPPPADERAARAERREVLERVNKGKPKTVRACMRALQEQAAPLDFGNMRLENQAPLEAFAGAVRALAADLRTSREAYNEVDLQPDVFDQVRLRAGTEEMFNALDRRVNTAADGEGTGPTRHALGRVYEAMRELGAALGALYPDVRGVTPRLATADIDACESVEVYLLACAAGLDIENTEETELREQLKRAKAKLSEA